jgi:energy-coupling factor transporter ATP-binding protein EcfA2
MYAEHMRDVVMAVFGLSHTINTKVGNDFIRGVSGGERKRVSIAEATLGNSPLQCWDNSTRGLDSATALEFVRSLRLSTELSGATAVVAIYQASQSIYDVFDKVAVLYEGRQIYFGDKVAAKTFFINMGFDCPLRQTTADFLTSLTSPAERIVRAGFEGKVPYTPDEFAARWQESEDRAQLLREIDEFDAQYPIGGEHLEKFKQSRIGKPLPPAVRVFPEFDVLLFHVFEYNKQTVNSIISRRVNQWKLLGQLFNRAISYLLEITNHTLEIQRGSDADITLSFSGESTACQVTIYAFCPYANWTVYGSWLRAPTRRYESFLHWTVWSGCSRTHYFERLLQPTK